jgi:preprotein translocase subunit Sss1
MAKVKAVSYRLIKPDSDEGNKLYPVMNHLVEKWHEELRQARIALAWSYAWKEDADGRVVLGRMKLATDLDRELHRFDIVILLNREFVESERVKPEQVEALIDHELTHATVKLDDHGEPLRDERDRIVYRARKHDLEEFSEIVRRHGIYKRDLEDFAKAVLSNQTSLLDPEPAPGLIDALANIAPRRGSGIASVEFSSLGHETVRLTAEAGRRLRAKARGLRDVGSN